MTIQLDEVVFDETNLRVRDMRTLEGGRMRRRVRLQGVLTDVVHRDAVEAMLDEGAAAAGEWAGWRALEIRPGRRLWVRPERFEREVGLDGQTGAFDLVVESRELTEEAVEPTTYSWDIADSHASLAIENDGTAPAPVALAYTPTEATTRPGFSIGARTLVYDGVVEAGQTLELDDHTGQVTLDGNNITPDCEGLPPRVGSGVREMVFTAEAGGSGTAEVIFHARWW